MADAQAEPIIGETDADTIAGRTRTKFSLVDVPIDTLEASLPDAVPEQTAPETEEDREYQRFLSSLLPNEQEKLWFLDEEDEEYRPEEEEDEHEDEDARRGISKKELTDLLLDSTHMTFPKPLLGPSRDEVLAVDSSDVALPVATSLSDAAGVAGNDMATAAPPKKLPVVMNLPLGKPAMFRGQRGAVTQAQCIQLASQMHKHLQLLLQSYHLLAGRPPTPELAECRAMIEELQQRGEKALKYKNALLSKLNPVAATENESVGAAGVKTPLSVGDTAGDSSGDGSTTENLLALRRVTRSLTAAHAAMAHPSMFELVGSQTVDELSAGFARGCSIEERDQTIQEQMLQLDTHLMSVKKRRKTKKTYSSTEDSLLAHGVKRFGTQADSWEQIQKHFLPIKTTQNLRHRYKYLISSKTGMSAIKSLHMKDSPQHRTSDWLLEEDLRIARGLVELHKEKYHFSRLAKTYLPHRSRLEIRKRWERIAAKFRVDLAIVGLDAPEDDSLDLAVAMKEYLEDKLRHRMLSQRREAEKAKLDAAFQLHQLGQGTRGVILPQSVGKSFPNALESSSGSAGVDPTQKMILDAASCKTKNLHPALFFSSWSFISPATLLNSTCKHNWPSFMDEGNDGKDKPQKAQPSAAASTGAVADIDVPQLTGSSGPPLSLGSEQMEEFMPIAMPSELGFTPRTDSAKTNISLDFHVEHKERKEAEEEDDDSDYEHDELLSSENDESESDFEQMELTDEDDAEAGRNDEASSNAFDQDTFMSDSDAQSVESANSLRTPIPSPLSSPSYTASPFPNQSPSSANGSSQSSPRIRHPLRLRNLNQPGNESMKRALAALERRIVGKSVNGSGSVSVASSLTGSKQRAKRKMTSTLVAPLGASRANAHTAFQESIDEPARTANLSDGNDDDEDDDDWEDGSGDEYEVVELPSSSDEFASASSDEEHPLPPQKVSVVPRQAPVSSSSDSAPPTKKAKLQKCPTCHHTACTCTSSERMQLLLRRMKEKRSSSSLQGATK